MERSSGNIELTQICAGPVQTSVASATNRDKLFLITVIIATVVLVLVTVGFTVPRAHGATACH
jgi:hypothetical protein